MNRLCCAWIGLGWVALLLAASSLVAAARDAAPGSGSRVGTQASPAEVFTPFAGGVLYQAGPDNGVVDWQLAPEWTRRDGLLVTEGPGRNRVQRAPYDAVEPEVRFNLRQGVSPTRCDGWGRPSFGLISHAGTTGDPRRAGADYGEYRAAIAFAGDTCEPPVAAELSVFLMASGDAGYAPLASGPVVPGPGWHIDRLEVQGDNLRLLIDEELAAGSTV